MSAIPWLLSLMDNDKLCCIKLTGQFTIAGKKLATFTSKNSTTSSLTS